MFMIIFRAKVRSKSLSLLKSNVQVKNKMMVTILLFSCLKYNPNVLAVTPGLKMVVALTLLLITWSRQS